MTVFFSLVILIELWVFEDFQLKQLNWNNFMSFDIWFEIVPVWRKLIKIFFNEVLRVWNRLLLRMGNGCKNRTKYFLIPAFVKTWFHFNLIRCPFFRTQKMRKNSLQNTSLNLSSLSISIMFFKNIDFEYYFSKEEVFRCATI